MSNLYHKKNNHDNKPCGMCGKIVKEGEPDPCFGGFLPGIAHACCGHGVTEDAYCVSWDECKPHDVAGLHYDDPTYSNKKGKEAIEYMKSLKPK